MNYREPSLTFGLRMTSSHKKVAVTSRGSERAAAASKIPCSGNRGRLKPTPVTNYAAFLKKSPPPFPPSLSKSLNQNGDHVTNLARRKEQPGSGKVKIVLRIVRDRSLKPTAHKNTFVRVETNQKHVSVYTPGGGANTKISLAPKVYAFDSVFTDQTSQMDICASSLTDVIPAVLQGADGTVFCYGQSNLGKTSVLMGNDSNVSGIGVIPCAISWLYRSIQEHEKHGNCKFTVSCSAIEIYGRQEKLRDLLAGYSDDPTTPRALTVSEDPLTGVQLKNQCEIRASTADRAAFYLDVALTSRSCNGARNTHGNRKQSHMIFTLNVTQTRTSDPQGKRSRLHFIDLGSCEKTLIKTPSSLALSLTSLGHVIMSIVNNSKHVPFRESKLTCVLREYLGNVNCRAVMIAHVSPDQQHYSDTLSTIQMASRIHRVIRKKNKCSGKENGYSHPMTRSNQIRTNSIAEESIGSSSGMEYTSGSELSCDTIVYVNPNGVLRSEQELTDNESPPAVTPIPNNFFQHQIPTADEMVYNVREAQIQSNRLEKGLKDRNIIDKQKAVSLVPHDNERRLCKSNCKPNIPSNPNKMPKKSLIPCPKSKISRNIKPSTHIPSQSKAQNNLPKSSDLSATLTQSNQLKSKQGIANNSKQDKLRSKPFKPPRNITESFQNVAKPTNKIPIQKPMATTQLHGKEIKKPQLKPFSQSKLCSDTGIPVPPRRSSSLLNIQRQPGDQKKVASHKIAKQQSGINRCNEISPYLENAKTVNDTVPHENIYENVILREMLTQNGQRFEPDGCDNAQQTLQQSLDQPLKDLAPTSNLRPDSMFVNIDDGFSSDDVTIGDVDDDDAVDVNFYCLTFTSNKPLIPLSRRKFCQQVKKSKREKSSSNESEMVSGSCDVETNDVTNETPIKSDLEYKAMVDPASVWASKTNIIEEIPMLNASDMEVIDFEGDDVFVEEPDYSEVHSPGAKNENVILADVIPNSKPIFNHDSTKNDRDCPQVCVYDSNSLEMSFIGSRNKHDMSSVSSPSRSSNNSSQEDARMRYNGPVTLTKTKSKEGPRLILVKKNSGSSLELKITQENFTDSENNNLSKSLAVSKCKEPKIPQKSPKWSGLKRFGSKRSDSKPSKLVPKQIKPAAKPTFVSKILSGKLKRKSDPLKQKNKDSIEIPVTISNIKSDVSAMHYGYKNSTKQISSGSRIRNAINGSNSRFGFPKHYRET